MKRLFDLYSRIQQYLSQLFSQNINWIFGATIFGRLVNFIVNWSIVRMLTQAEYGRVAFALTIISFILPFIGGGILSGMTHYGAQTNGQLEKKYFIRFAVRHGLLISSITLFVLWGITPFLPIAGSGIFLAILGIQLIGLLIQKSVSLYCLIIHKNEWYAKIEILLSLSYLIFNILAGYFFGALGYIISLVSIPFIIGIYFWQKLNLSYQAKQFDFKFDTKALVNFGFFNSLGTLLSQMLYSVDILLIGYMIKQSEAISQYKVASIIPLNLIILSTAVMTSILVKLSKNVEENPRFLVDFYKKYLLVFIPISLLILVVFYFGSDWIIQIFGKDYREQSDLMFIFSFGVVGGLLLRTPLGNMISIMGYPRMNAFFSLIALIMNILGSYWALQHYGLAGAAAVTSSMFWISGLFSLGVFFWWKKKG